MAAPATAPPPAAEQHWRLTSPAFSALVRAGRAPQPTSWGNTVAEQIRFLHLAGCAGDIEPDVGSGQLVQVPALSAAILESRQQAHHDPARVTVEACSSSASDSAAQFDLGLLADMALSEDTHQIIVNALESVEDSIVSDEAMMTLQNAACVLATNPYLARVSTSQLASMCAAIGRSTDAHDAASYCSWRPAVAGCPEREC